jgi:TolB protein
MSVDGELAQLTYDPADDLDPDWSPDGTRIAFSSNRAGMHHIYVVNGDGSSVTQITTANADDTEPAWSRDGKRIAFVRALEGNREIYVVNVDGSNETRLTFNPGVDVSPNWSSDGRIFFTSTRDGRGEIYVMNADGGGVSRFTTTGAKSPASSPDGSKVAFLSMSLPYQSPVFVADPNGANARMATKDPLSAFWPCWSPDGASIAVAVDSLGVSNIFQIDSLMEIGGA